jgi:hypothetical protein
MKTPTSALERPAVTERTPAAPASSATTTDQRSGRQMKPVSGRAAARSAGEIQPAARASRASAVAAAIATRKPSSSSFAACRRARPGEHHPDADRGHRPELRPDDHRADHEDRRVGDHGDARDRRRERQEGVERPGGLGVRAGPGEHRGPDDPVLARPRAASSAAAAAREEVASTSAIATAPSCSRTHLAEGVDHLRGGLPGHVAGHRVARRSIAAPGSRTMCTTRGSSRR